MIFVTPVTFIGSWQNVQGLQTSLLHGRRAAGGQSHVVFIYFYFFFLGNPPSDARVDVFSTLYVTASNRLLYSPGVQSNTDNKYFGFWTEPTDWLSREKRSIASITWFNNFFFLRLSPYNNSDIVRRTVCSGEYNIITKPYGSTGQLLVSNTFSGERAVSPSAQTVGGNVRKTHFLNVTSCVRRLANEPAEFHPVAESYSDELKPCLNLDVNRVIVSIIS